VTRNPLSALGAGLMAGGILNTVLMTVGNPGSPAIYAPVGCVVLGVALLLCGLKGASR
jgi:hypothetical protein